MLRDIDRAGYLALEEFVRDRLLAEGFDANLTCLSGDGGADIVVRDEFGKIVYLVQCKHTNNIEMPLDAGLLTDADRVRNRRNRPVLTTELRTRLGRMGLLSSKPS